MSIFRANVRGEGSDHITPPEFFFNRRQFVRATAATSMSMAPLMGCGSASLEDPPPPKPVATPPNPLEIPISWPDGFSTPRNEAYPLPSAIDQALTPRRVAATHNNFYEFLMGRAGPVWKHAGKFEVDPWTIEVSGECRKPLTLDLDDLTSFPHEERLYHFRCVERWAMNVPWAGFPLRLLLEKVEPTSNAKFVRFETAHRPEQMPGLNNAAGRGYPFPYVEALRMDEAMNELTMIATGVYGEPLPKQHGSPLRVVAPWKYGYKNPKSIVKIELTREQPPCFWSMGPQGHEYGFLSNVNPSIPHPRWSQSRSYWVDREEWFDTPIFNGYEHYVADLYPDEPRTMQQPLNPGDVAR